MACFLGIDIGTSSVKVIVIDGAGHQVTLSQRDYAFDTPFPLWAEQNPYVWWEASCEAIREVVSRVGASEIDGIGLSGQMHGFLPLDQMNEPIGNCIIWADRRSSKEVEDVYSLLGRDTIAQICHSPVGTGFLVPSLLWVKRNQPDVYARISSLVLPKDFIRLQLTGKVGTDISDASATLAFDVDKGCWSDCIISALEFPKSAFPYAGESNEIAGAVTREASRMTGLLAGTPVVFGGADQVMQAIGNGISKPGPVSVTIGTGGQVLSILDHPIVDTDLVSHCFSFTSNKLWYFLGATLSGGYSLRWLRTLLGNSDSYQEIDSMSANIPIGSERLVFLPYLSGERTPHMDSFARGMFFGLSNNHGRANMYRAVMEGVTFSLKECIDVLMKNTDLNPDEIVASGGSSKSPFWMQMEADVFNKKIVVSPMKEQAAAGAALTAGVGVGFFESFEKALPDYSEKESRSYRPIPENVEQYKRMFEIYKQIYIDNKTEMRTLFDLA